MSTREPNPVERMEVLIVEDEPILRLDAVDLVEDAGFEALEASNAQEALRLLADHPGVAILFTDVEMPGGMNGLELAERVHALYPEMSIVVASAHTRIDTGRLPRGAAFFPKPYRPTSLVQWLQSSR